MNKPISMVVKETKIKLAKVCNESGLHPIILDLILQGVYSEVHALADKQSFDEEMVYVESLKEKVIKDKENVVEE